MYEKETSTGTHVRLSISLQEQAHTIDDLLQAKPVAPTCQSSH